jgi:predicted TIM-barrel fold metal-dependent hydrolase
MIVDGHGHIFENWAGSNGHESHTVHLKYLQKSMLRPSARVLRARDGARVDMSQFFPLGDNTWQSLRGDVEFRPGSYGRAEFTIDGEEYWIQYLPVNMKDLEAPPELMIAHMKLAGVDHMVLQASLSYGIVTDINASAQARYPEKFSGLFQVDEGMADAPRWMREVERAHRDLQLRGLYYQMDNFGRYGFASAFDDPRFDDFWELEGSFSTPVFFQLSSLPNGGADGYTANAGKLDALVARYPEKRWVLVMGAPVEHFGGSGRWNVPEEVDRIYRRENVSLELMYPILWGGVWEYPFPEAQALIRDLRDRYGAGKLIWGSDMPNVERFCTYTQVVDYVRRHCAFLSASEKEQILGRNIAELLQIKAI